MLRKKTPSKMIIEKSTDKHGAWQI